MHPFTVTYRSETWWIIQNLLSFVAAVCAAISLSWYVFDSWKKRKS